MGKQGRILRYTEEFNPKTQTNPPKHRGRGKPDRGAARGAT